MEIKNEWNHRCPVLIALMPRIALDWAPVDHFSGRLQLASSSTLGCLAQVVALQGNSIKYRHSYDLDAEISVDISDRAMGH